MLTKSKNQKSKKKKKREKTGTTTMVKLCILEAGVTGWLIGTVYKKITSEFLRTEGQRKEKKNKRKKKKLRNSNKCHY